MKRFLLIVLFTIFGSLWLVQPNIVYADDVNKYSCDSVFAPILNKCHSVHGHDDDKFDLILETDAPKLVKLPNDWYFGAGILTFLDDDAFEEWGLTLRFTYDGTVLNLENDDD